MQTREQQQDNHTHGFVASLHFLRDHRRQNNISYYNRNMMELSWRSLVAPCVVVVDGDQWLERVE